MNSDLDGDFEDLETGEKHISKKSDGNTVIGKIYYYLIMYNINILNVFDTFLFFEY